jgi:hypothetical protein
MKILAGASLFKECMHLDHAYTHEDDIALDASRILIFWTSGAEITSRFRG